MDLTHRWLDSVGATGTERCRIEFVLRGNHRRLDGVDTWDVPFELADPVRGFPAWRGKRYYSGYFWLSTLRRHVAFESLFERAFLMSLDRDPSIVGVSSQPMWITWHARDPVQSHAPDYFVRRAGRTPRMIQPLPLTIDPVPGETPDSLLARLAVANTLPIQSLWAVIRSEKPWVALNVEASQAEREVAALAGLPQDHFESERKTHRLFARCAHSGWRHAPCSLCAPLPPPLSACRRCANGQAAEVRAVDDARKVGHSDA